MRRFLVLSFIFLSTQVFSATWNIRLEIKSGQIAVAGGGTLDYELFTSSTGFPKCSDLFVWELGDIVNLKVVNTLSNPRGFAIENYVDLGSILPGDSAEQQITLNQAGVFRYFDPGNSPYNAYKGLHGVIHIKEIGDAAPYFYWEMRELDSVWIASISSGGTPALSSYDPKFFTINGNSNPDINNDPVARVIGANGQEFRIVMVNNGVSIHSIHFHGYHLVILNDSKHPAHVGRNKDTFPVYPSEHIVLSCIPDKGGEYPVHDHNLVAITGNSMYANGMFTTLLIAP